MSLLERDLPWLLAEAHNDPDVAQQIVETLAGRIQELQRQTDELRAENTLLKRTGGQQASTEQLNRLKTTLHDLHQLVTRAGLNRDVVTVLDFSGMGLHLPTPAPMEQTLRLLSAPDDPISMHKPLYLAHGSWLHTLLAITSGLRMLLVNGLAVPISEHLDWRDAHTISGLGLSRAERVEAVLPLDELHPPHDVLIVSRQGWVRSISWSHVEMLAYSGQSITLPNAGDSPVWLGESDTDADLLILTRNGRWTRFPMNVVPARGCAGITLDSNDDVVSAVVVDKTTAAVWFIGADGTTFVLSAMGLEAHKKAAGKAVPLTRRFVGLTCYRVQSHKARMALLLSNEGDLHVLSTHGLPIAAKPSEVQPLKVSNERLIAATPI